VDVLVRGVRDRFVKDHGFQPCVLFDQVHDLLSEARPRDSFIRNDQGLLRSQRLDPAPRLRCP
jgi:hypothetical protein